MGNISWDRASEGTERIAHLIPLKGLPNLLRESECTMAYQPIVTPSAEVFGYEALLRGFMGIELPNPDVLFKSEGSLSEEILVSLDASCIGAALRMGRNLAKKRRLFINIHSVTLPRLSQHRSDIRALLHELGIEPARIVFELASQAPPSLPGRPKPTLASFVELGTEVAIHDVGASFNWLHHVIHTRPAYLKMERLVTSGIDSSERKKALVRSLVHMTQTMGIRVIAQGVENEAQFSALREIGADFLQGFHIGRPQSAEYWEEA